jgi:hypothetical protein
VLVRLGLEGCGLGSWCPLLWALGAARSHVDTATWLSHYPIPLCAIPRRVSNMRPFQTPMTSSHDFMLQAGQILTRHSSQGCACCCCQPPLPGFVAFLIRRFGRSSYYGEYATITAIWNWLLLWAHQTTAASSPVSRGVVHVSIGAVWWLAAWQPQP